MKLRDTNSRTPKSLRSEFRATSTSKLTGLSLGASALMLLPGVVLAESPPERQLATVKVQDTALDPNPNAEVGVPYKAKTSGDERHTRPLAETPQTITVITKTAIDDSGATDLRQILDGQPGITLGTGENGNAFGDRYIIRGQEARSDVFVDGLRDPGMTTRESFVIEQLEISKGPNSSFAGRGTSGGAINAITKQANTAFDFARVGAGFGTDDYVRTTLDVNHSFGEQFAVRANALYASEEVPDRGPADRERKGLAVSGLYLPTDKLSITLDFYGLRADDNPDLGSYLVGTVPDRKPAKDVPVYAQKEDFLESDVNTGTARVRYDFSETVHLSNLTRYGTSDNGYVATGARSATTSTTNPDGVYTTATLSTHQGWQEVDYFANQTNLFVERTLLGREHDFILGMEYTDHSVLNGVYNVTNSGQNCRTNTGTTNNAWCITGPDGNAVEGLRTLMNRQISRGSWDIDWAVKTVSFSVMDTFDITDKWTVFAGVRADRFDFELETQTASTGVRTAKHDYKDTLWNGQLGVTYKINELGIVYAGYATAADINGGESDVGTNSGYGGLMCTTTTAGELICSDKPEKSRNIELGTKWNLFGDTLLLTGALFQTTKDDVMEGANYETFGTFNTGKSRVRGVEVGLAGKITSALTGQIGATIMDSEVLESATDANEGKTLSNFAEKSVSAQLKYEFFEDFYVGAAAKYESKRYGGQPDTAATYEANGDYSQPVPAYTVFDLFAAYRFNKNLDTRLNIGNVTDKDYYTAVYRSGSFLYKGDARTARLTFNYEF